MEIISSFPDDFKIISLAENARSFYYLAKKHGIEKSCFPMIGSMGQELSMGLGVALGAAGKTNKKCIIISSDGSFLANINALATIGILIPNNLVILLIDNEMHGITGGQPTATPFIKLGAIAEACRFESRLVLTKKELHEALKAVNKTKGPVFIQIKVNSLKPPLEAIQEITPTIFRNFSRYIHESFYNNPSV